MVNRYAYIVRCADETLYTGITTNVERRVVEHNSFKKGAKYTKTRQPVILVWSSCYATRDEAAREERRIKKLSREQKKLLIDSSFR